jgi:hypothetical protein
MKTQSPATIESVTAMIEATELALANLKRLRVDMNLKLNREKCDREGHKWTPPSAYCETKCERCGVYK